MNINRIALAAFATTLCISPAAYAEDSERETPIEEYELAQKTDPLPGAVKSYLAQLEDIDHRYPDSGKVDIDQFMAAEGESLALGYCGALGFNGACVVEEKDGEETFVALDSSSATPMAEGRGKWWEWLLNHLFNVGVIQTRVLSELRCAAHGRECAAFGGRGVRPAPRAAVGAEFSLPLALPVRQQT